MIYSRVTQQPLDEPITLAQAKTHLKVDGTDDDDFITRQIRAARRIGENYSGLSFLTQEREIKLDGFPCGVLDIPYGPVQSIDSFTYIKTDETTGTLVEGTDFRVSKIGARTRLEAIDGWPSTNYQVDAVTIQYTSGYTNAGEDYLPEEIPEAVAKTVARLYEKRGDDAAGTVLTYEIMDLYDTVKVYWNAHV
jgi:uncharacterized phiE125 gp8 family phage protein